MYKISGELLPCVFHVSARSLATHALSIFGDHADVMACRQTGFAILSSNSVQEAMDMAVISHLATLENQCARSCISSMASAPLPKCRRSDAVEYDELAPLMPWDKVKEFRGRALNPDHPHQAGTAQNPDIYFQNREAANKHYDDAPAIIEDVMAKVSKLVGREYKPYQYVGAPDADKVIMAMGSGLRNY